METNIKVKITYQSNRILTAFVTASELMYLSGTLAVKALEIINWNIKTKEYRRVAQ